MGVDAKTRQAMRATTGAAPLTQQQRSVAENVGRGMSWRAAMMHAGYKDDQLVGKFKKDPRMIAVITAEQAKNAKTVEMTRSRVMEGLMEALDVARSVSDPHAMIKAWDTVAKMCGYMQPEVKKIDISITAKRLVGKLEQLSDEELAKLAESEVGPVIEGEFEEIVEEQRALPAPAEPEEAPSDE